MQLFTFDTPDQSSKALATFVISRIKAFAPNQQNKFVLCLPTGSTPLGLYRELARSCRKGEVSFEFVITFNLDEYVGLGPTHPQSCHTSMEKEFFSKIDLPPSNQNLLYGLADNLETECANYESRIQSCGGINLLVAGIGENGHLAFNEPGSPLSGGTRVVALDEGTRVINARFFEGKIENVPTHALTMGIGSIMAAKEIVLIAHGEKKAEAMKDWFQSGVSHMYPASILQLHPSVSLYADTEATHLLSPRTLKALTPPSHATPSLPIPITEVHPDQTIHQLSPPSAANAATTANIEASAINDDDTADTNMMGHGDTADSLPVTAVRLPPLIIRFDRRGGGLRVVTTSPLTPISP